MPLELFPVVLFFISFFGLINTNNIIKSIVFIILLQSSAIMLWIVYGAAWGSLPPIDVAYADPYTIADPLPQTLMLTAIVIGISVMAINITMLNTLFRKYETANWIAMGKLVSEDMEKKKNK